jgi:hypothetical protein
MEFFSVAGDQMDMDVDDQSDEEVESTMQSLSSNTCLPDLEHHWPSFPTTVQWSCQGGGCSSSSSSCEEHDVGREVEFFLNWMSEPACPCTTHIAEM